MQAYKGGSHESAVLFWAFRRRKSHRLYQEIIARSMEREKQNFMIVVPDQFTMQTQKELVTMHPPRVL